LNTKVKVACTDVVQEVHTEVSLE